VRKSDGHEFLPNVTWQTTLVGNWGPWIVSDPAFSWPWDYKDVNGDGMADEIYVENQGVLVRLSTGSQLAARQPWTDIPYYGTVGTYFADVTGDHRADAVVVNMDGVTVRRSDGSQFRPNDPPWSSAYYGDFAPNCLQ
jgi:hypothetical protein